MQVPRGFCQIAYNLPMLAVATAFLRRDHTFARVELCGIAFALLTMAAFAIFPAPNRRWFVRFKWRAVTWRTWCDCDEHWNPRQTWSAIYGTDEAGPGGRSGARARYRRLKSPEDHQECGGFSVFVVDSCRFPSIWLFFYEPRVGVATR